MRLFVDEDGFHGRSEETSNSQREGQRRYDASPLDVVDRLSGHANDRCQLCLGQAAQLAQCSDPVTYMSNLFDILVPVKGRESDDRPSAAMDCPWGL